MKHPAMKQLTLTVLTLLWGVIDIYLSIFAALLILLLYVALFVIPFCYLTAWLVGVKT